MFVSLYRLQLKKYDFIVTYHVLFRNTHFYRELNFVANTRFFTQNFTQKKTDFTQKCEQKNKNGAPPSDPKLHQTQFLYFASFQSTHCPHFDSQR